MALPPSFASAGFVPPAQARQRMRLKNGKFLKPLMIGTEGETCTGKTEFLFSCPNPGMIILLDRMFDGTFDNPKPPQARNTDGFGVKIIKVPHSMGAADDPGKQADYAKYYKEVRESLRTALGNPDALTVAIDGDSDFWELQRLAYLGKLTKIFPATRYSDVYAMRRQLTNEMWDANKIIIGTNKVKDEYEAVRDSKGVVLKDDSGEDKRQKTGRKERQGFPDQDFLWQIQLRHFYIKPKMNEKLGRMIPGQYGIQILKCKHDRSLEGTELTGNDCNFRGLVKAVYPEVDPGCFGLA